jgi:hypothetical protein
LTAGEWYVNVHTQANPNGKILCRLKADTGRAI